MPQVCCVVDVVASMVGKLTTLDTTVAMTTTTTTTLKNEFLIVDIFALNVCFFAVQLFNKFFHYS